jgi:hypothetical protein
MTVALSVSEKLFQLELAALFSLSHIEAGSEGRAAHLADLKSGILLLWIIIAKVRLRVK